VVIRLKTLGLRCVPLRFSGAVAATGFVMLGNDASGDDTCNDELKDVKRK
jgi:hypothetical protein